VIRQATGCTHGVRNLLFLLVGVRTGLFHSPAHVLLQYTITVVIQPPHPRLSGQPALVYCLTHTVGIAAGLAGRCSSAIFRHSVTFRLWFCWDCCRTLGIPDCFCCISPRASASCCLLLPLIRLCAPLAHRPAGGRLCPLGRPAIAAMEVLRCCAVALLLVGLAAHRYLRAA